MVHKTFQVHKVVEDYSNTTKVYWKPSGGMSKFLDRKYHVDRTAHNQQEKSQILDRLVSL
jgi:hypothetical protein